VVRRQPAKLLFAGSIPARASIQYSRKFGRWTFPTLPSLLKRRFVSPFSLRIVRVFYLKPSVLAIHARFPLTHNPLQVPLADLLKQTPLKHSAGLQNSCMCFGGERLGGTSHPQNKPVNGSRRASARKSNPDRRKPLGTSLASRVGFRVTRFCVSFLSVPLLGRFRFLSFVGRSGSLCLSMTPTFRFGSLSFACKSRSRN
jgi:hypothetical protein